MSDIPYELLMKIQHGTMNTRYRGLPMLKNPFDLALYTMLLERVQPATLIEIGTNAGGSALWFADQRSGMRVLSIDLEPPESVSHSSVRFLFDGWLHPGEYIVVEDGILTAMRAAEAYDGGPLRAIHEFLARSGGRYEIDGTLCHYYGRNVTWNVDGYLRRIA